MLFELHHSRHALNVSTTPHGAGLDLQVTENDGLLSARLGDSGEGVAPLESAKSQGIKDGPVKHPASNSCAITGVRRYATKQHAPTSRRAGVLPSGIALGMFLSSDDR